MYVNLGKLNIVIRTSKKSITAYSRKLKYKKKNG